jgi:hypothetical protein
MPSMKTITIPLFLLLSVIVWAQTGYKANKMYQQSLNMAEQGDFKTAIQFMKRVQKAYPKNPEVHYALGDFYLNTPSGADSALIYLETAFQLLPVADRNSIVGADIQTSLAHTYHLLLKPQKAIETYQNLLTVIPEGSSEIRTTTEREIEMCNNLIEAMKNPVRMEVRNVGKTINSRNDDHSPLISADGQTLFFTSRRPSSYSTSMPDGQYAEKVYFSNRDSSSGSWGKPVNTNRLFRTQGHEACVSLSADGQELILFRNDADGKNLYSSLREGKAWTEPSLLPKPINSPANETHLTMNADRSVMYFTSDRSGGFGGLDIYQVRRLPDGSWSKAMNMGPVINTVWDEETPMLHPDGKRLYFASKGHNSVGGFDIFISQAAEDSTWGTPVNIGYPINTPDDDLFFAPTVMRNQAYYASATLRDGLGGMDIYLIEYEDPIENRLAVYTGIVNSAIDAPLESIKVLVKDKATGITEGEYRPNAATGNYVLILESGKSYELFFEGAGFENQMMNLDVPSKLNFSATHKSMPIGTVALNYVAPVITDTVSVSTKEVPLFSVQILALTQPCKSWDKAFKGLDTKKIKEYECSDKYYRYVYGTYNNYREAMKAAEVLQATPTFSDAFVRRQKELMMMIQNK